LSAVNAFLAEVKTSGSFWPPSRGQASAASRWPRSSDRADVASRLLRLRPPDRTDRGGARCVSTSTRCRAAPRVAASRGSSGLRHAGVEDVDSSTTGRTSAERWYLSSRLQCFLTAEPRLTGSRRPHRHPGGLASADVRNASRIVQCPRCQGMGRPQDSESMRGLHHFRCQPAVEGVGPPLKRIIEQLWMYTR